jgi:hypothetical protein
MKGKKQMAKMNRKSENNSFSRPMSVSSGSETSVMTSNPERPQTQVKEIVSSKKNVVITRQQIEERARKIWQQNGCPVGQDEKNWLEAEAQLKKELGIK